MTSNDAAGTGKVTDVVCGMTIERGSAAGTSEHGGTTYYFCSTGCKAKFDAEPMRYMGGSAMKG